LRAFIVRRLALSIIALLGVLVVTYLLMHLAPVDPAIQYAGIHATPEQLAAANQLLGLNRSIPVQILVYIKNFFTGNWGVSLVSKRPVIEDIGQVLPFTVELVALAEVLLLLIGVPLGILSAHKKDRWPDQASRVFSVGVISIPTFWLALALQYIVAGKLHLLPLSGADALNVLYAHPIKTVTGFPLIDTLVTGNFAAFWDHVAHLVLPVVALTATALGLIQRLTRAGMVEVLGEEYILASRSYGMPERIVLWHHGLKNALAPVATCAASLFAFNLVNTFLVETIFSYPGVGAYIARSVVALDYPVIMAVTLISAVAFLTMNMLADILIATDPRVRLT
jgi:peptide/nickel transport system permease protein